MRRLVPSIVPLVSLLLLAACTDSLQPPTAPGDARRDELEAPVASGELGDSLPGISPTNLLLFRRGRYLFQVQFRRDEGLGPAYNARACSTCHGGDNAVFNDSATTSTRLETHFARLNADGSCSPLANRGGFVKQDSVTNLLQPYFTEEPLPSVTHQIAHRITPDLFGFGLIAAIPAESIQARADPNDADGDGISGRANSVNNVLGRFGRKAAGLDLDHFNAGALLNEIGITNPEFPHENSVGVDTIGGAAIPYSVDPWLETDSLEMKQADLDALNAFVRFLAPPPSTGPTTTKELWGEALFDSIGCIKCHTPQFTTVSSDSALNGKTVRPFSDFLLHEMGSGDICLASAGPTEFRTEPLMGARLMQVFMHDGSAVNLNQAIFQHGGEALAARTAYSNLSSDQRAAIIAYIKTL